jgi:hypothetical protein
VINRLRIVFMVLSITRKRQGPSPHFRDLHMVHRRKSPAR